MAKKTTKKKTEPKQPESLQLNERVKNAITAVVAVCHVDDDHPRFLEKLQATLQFILRNQPGTIKLVCDDTNNEPQSGKIVVDLYLKEEVNSELFRYYSWVSQAKEVNFTEVIGEINTSL